MRVRRTELPQLLLEGALMLAPSGLLLGRRQARIRPGVGNGPVIDGFDILSPLLYLSIFGILLFELVAIS